MTAEAVAVYRSLVSLGAKVRLAAAVARISRMTVGKVSRLREGLAKKPE